MIYTVLRSLTRVTLIMGGVDKKGEMALVAMTDLVRGTEVRGRDVGSEGQLGQ